jgi:P27 family predicted phage terminase small subunit
VKTGRPPLPTRLKLLRGTLKPSRRNLREPEPPQGPPAVPSALPPDARPAWDWLVAELTSMRVITRSDGPALLLASRRLTDYLDFERFVTEHGWTVKVTMTNGSQRECVRPEVALMNTAWRDTLAALGQLGLTPSARSRVVVTPQESANAKKAREFFGD